MGEVLAVSTGKMKVFDIGCSQSPIFSKMGCDEKRLSESLRLFVIQVRGVRRFQAKYYPKKFQHPSNSV